MNSDANEIHTLLAAYATAWNAGRPSDLARYWDRDLAEPIYVAEEEDVLVGWPAIEAYWAALDGVDMSAEFGTAWLTPLHEGVVAAVYPMRWRLALAGHSFWTRPIAGHVRASAVLARRPVGWKFVHYVEAPLAAALQVKQWLEDEAAR